MTSRNTRVAAERAARQLADLLHALAPDGRCALCGVVPTESLQVDHVDGKTWTPRKLNRWARVKRYVDEYRAGVRLRALCKLCNGTYRPPGHDACGHRVENLPTP